MCSSLFVMLFSICNLVASASKKMAPTSKPTVAGEFESSAFFQAPGNDCHDHLDNLILEEWAKDYLVDQFNLTVEPIFNLFDSQPGTPTNRMLFECAPDFCTVNSDLCVIAGCPGMYRRRHLLGSLDEDYDETFLLSGMEALEVVLEDADTVILMEGEDLELEPGSTCDLSNLWFVVFTQ